MLALEFLLFSEKNNADPRMMESRASGKGRQAFPAVA